MADAPTARQREFLDVVAELTTELGEAPTAADIARRLGIGRTGARAQLMALEAKGLLVNPPVTVPSGKWRLP
jgi:predicted ArsR family transcriptional regulator